MPERRPPTSRLGRSARIGALVAGQSGRAPGGRRAARALVPLVKRLSPGLNGRALVEELRERISEELDYELEAANGRRIARAWRDHPHVVVPSVDTSLSTRRVLVTEWIDGDGFGGMKQLPDDERDFLGETIYRFFFA